MSVETLSSDGFRAATVEQLIADQRVKGLSPRPEVEGCLRTVPRHLSYARLIARGRLLGGSGG